MDEGFKEKFEIKVIGETSLSPPEEMRVSFCSNRLKLHSSDESFKEKFKIKVIGSFSG